VPGAWCLVPGAWCLVCHGCGPASARSIAGTNPLLCPIAMSAAPGHKHPLLGHACSPAAACLLQVDATVLATLLCPPEQQLQRDCICRLPASILDSAEVQLSTHEAACQRAQHAAMYFSSSPALWKALGACSHAGASAALLAAAAHLAQLEPSGLDPSAAPGYQQTGGWPATSTSRRARCVAARCLCIAPSVCLCCCSLSWLGVHMACRCSFQRPM
jgi:hypothetical protein